MPAGGGEGEGMDGLMDCGEEDRRVFGITEDWSIAALDVGAWDNT